MKFMKILLSNLQTDLLMEFIPYLIITTLAAGSGKKYDDKIGT